MIKPRIAVIGLGYVGLPLAVALARHFPVLGFDINQERVKELKAGVDRTNEVEPDVLKEVKLKVSAETSDLRNNDVYIITVPTPVDGSNRPDLGPVKSACRTVGKAMGKGAIVVLESTVYPGVTEDICGPLLAEISGLKCGKDFFLGYSPERINPGDREHTVDRITKVVSGQTPEVAEKLAHIYGKATTGGAFMAANIKTAEAAKVIENAQRDINIAFINEVTMIFNRLGISVFDVLDAARTKWNFLPFTPGLVGGHCIGVDPYYLTYKAEQVGHHPQVILSGRQVNDSMGVYVAHEVLRRVMSSRRASDGLSVTVLGVTFKEDVPDFRNTRVKDIVAELQGHGVAVQVHDPLADPARVERAYGFPLTPTQALAPAAAVVVAVPHAAYRQGGWAMVQGLLAGGRGLVADIRGCLDRAAKPVGIDLWRL